MHARPAASAPQLHRLRHSGHCAMADAAPVGLSPGSPATWHGAAVRPPVLHHLSAWDGLPLLVREWDSGDRLVPLLCLPGLVRTGGDFAALVPLLGAGRRMVAIDYAGRGGSGRARDLRRYAPEA